MRRSEQRRAAVIAVYQHDLTGRPLVEDCAALATQAAAELEQLTRDEGSAPAPGQDTLL